MTSVVFLGGMVALYIAAYSYGRTAADRSYDRLLSTSARSIADSLMVTGDRVDVDIPYGAFEMLSAAPQDRVFYRVFTDRGNTITGYSDLPLPDSGPSLRSRARRPDARFFDARYSGEPVRFTMIGRRIAHAQDGASVWVQLGQTRLAREALTRELVIRSLVPIALMTVLALALVWFAIGRALRPLERIGRDLENRQPADLNPVQPPFPVEIAPLVHALNGFMGRLGTNIDTLRAFVGNAAHQLRTPVAAIRAHAQLGLSEDAAGMRRGLGTIDRNAAKLSRLINQLLSEATVSHRSDMRSFEPLDLVDVVHEAVHDASPISSELVVRVDVEVDEAPMRGDPLMLAEALKNLIHNVEQHGGEHPVADVALAEEDDAYVITVADRGPGIGEGPVAPFFERFARGRPGGSGAGLGLAIVKQVVDSHGGSVTVDNREGGGLRVRMTLPRPRP